MKFVSWVRSKRVYCEIKLLKSLLFFPLLRLFGDLDLPFFPKSFFFALNFIECKQLRRYFSSILKKVRKKKFWLGSLAYSTNLPKPTYIQKFRASPSTLYVFELPFICAY